MSDSIGGHFAYSSSDLPEISQCLRCRFKVDGEPRCEAYPVEIPLPILANLHDHRKPYPEDNGIRFKPKEETE